MHANNSIQYLIPLFIWGEWGEGGDFNQLSYEATRDKMEVKQRLDLITKSPLLT